MDRIQVSFTQAIEGYFIAAHARRLSAHTLRDYDTTFRRFEEWLGKDPPLFSITAADIRAFIGSLDGLSAKTALNYHTGLSALWTWAVKERLVEKHVVRDVTPPKREKRAIIPYTEHDVRALLAACDRSQAYTRPGKRKSDHARPTALRDRAIITLLVDTGIRASELCSLRLADVDLKNRRVRVLGKGDKERLLSIAPRTAQRIWRYLATRDDRSSNAPLFTAGHGGPMNRHNLRHMVQGVARRAGVPRATVHRFRHTLSLQFLRNGANVFALKEALGHESMTMVLRYLDLAQADVKEAHRVASPVANWVL